MEADASGAIKSQVLNLSLTLQEGRLLLIDSSTGERLLRFHEERELRLKAEAENEKLRQELKKRKG